MKLTTISGVPTNVLGLAASKTMKAQCLNQAFTAGINYFFFYQFSAIENLVAELKIILADHRKDIVIATGSESRSFQELQQYLDSVRSCLHLNVIDVFFLEYVSPNDKLAQIQDLIQQLKVWQQKGWIRYLGVSTHNRKIALKIIETGQVDVLMHRYNMAHVKAETTVFPAAVAKKIPVIAFTGTRWGTLLAGHRDWHDKIPTAADCYRYALNHEAVNMVLTAPQNLSELSANLQVLSDFRLTQKEKTFWRTYGNLIYGKGQDSFETRWL